MAEAAAGDTLILTPANHTRAFILHITLYDHEIFMAMHQLMSIYLHINTIDNSVLSIGR